MNGWIRARGRGLGELGGRDGRGGGRGSNELGGFGLVLLPLGEGGGDGHGEHWLAVEGRPDADGFLVLDSRLGALEDAVGGGDALEALTRQRVLASIWVQRKDQRVEGLFEAF